MRSVEKEKKWQEIRDIGGNIFMLREISESTLVLCLIKCGIIPVYILTLHNKIAVINPLR